QVAGALAVARRARKGRSEGAAGTQEGALGATHGVLRAAVVARATFRPARHHRPARRQRSLQRRGGEADSARPALEADPGDPGRAWWADALLDHAGDAPGRRPDRGDGARALPAQAGSDWAVAADRAAIRLRAAGRQARALPRRTRRHRQARPTR